MAIQSNHVTSIIHNTNMVPDSDDQSNGTDDDEWSDTSSEVTQLDAADFPGYFQERNGRLFHSHGGSPYPLPVDTAEQNRVNEQHALLYTRLGAHYVGPVRDVLREGRAPRALDLGTGTGRWVLDMAEQFPHVKFYGVDIVPIATRYPPRNVTFEMHDISRPFRYDSGYYDLVHGRSISMAVRNYRSLLDEVARVLRPGGLFVACEWARSACMVPGRDLRNIPRSTEFFRVLNDTLLTYRGINNVAPHLGAFIQQSGHFGSIHQRRVEMPIGGDDLGNRHKRLLKMYVESAKVVLLEIARLHPDWVEELVRGYLYELDHVPGMVSIYYMVWARR